MLIRVNGENRECPQGSTLLDLVQQVGLVPEKVVAEHNRVIVRAADFAAITMKDNDEVELLQFVGGG